MKENLDKAFQIDLDGYQKGYLTFDAAEVNPTLKDSKDKYVDYRHLTIIDKDILAMKTMQKALKYLGFFAVKKAFEENISELSIGWSQFDMTEEEVPGYLALCDIWSKTYNKLCLEAWNINQNQEDFKKELLLLKRDTIQKACMYAVECQDAASEAEVRRELRDEGDY